MAGQQGGDLSADFAEFIRWRDAQRAAQQEQDFDVPIFEKGPDGTERSTTIPFSQAKHLLANWWPDLQDALGLGEGKGDGSQKAGSGQQAQGAAGSNPIARLFGGGQQQPARGARAPRQGQG